LPDNLRTTGTDSGANGELALARGTTRGEKICQIRASDQLHECDRS